MTITILKRTIKYFPVVDKKEPEIKEKVISEFRTTPENATAILEMLRGEYSCPIFNKDNDIEFSQSINIGIGKPEEEIIIKFVK